MPDLPGYVGVDIVPGAIASARTRFPGRDFRVADIVLDDLPRADAVLCRDVLQHLPLADGLSAIENFRRAGARFLLSSTHEGGRNRNVPAGRWFAIDLEAAPFSLGPPLESFPDGSWASGVAFPTRRFGVWRISE